MVGGLRSGGRCLCRGHEGLQVLRIAGITGVILHPFDGPSVTGVLTGFVLTLLVAGQVHDTKTTPMRPILEDGLLIAEPFAVLNDVVDVVYAALVGFADGHLAGDVIVLGHGELFGQARLAVNAVARLVEFDRVIGITAIMWRAILGDEADETPPC